MKYSKKHIIDICINKKAVFKSVFFVIFLLLIIISIFIRINNKEIIETECVTTNQEETNDIKEIEIVAGMTSHLYKNINEEIYLQSMKKASEERWSIIEPNETNIIKQGNVSEEEIKVNNRENKLYCIYEKEIDGHYALDEKYQDYLWEMCKKYEVEDYYKLFLAQIYHESGYDENCVSSTNDYGLMQINKCNHEWLSKTIGKSDFLNPYTSIEAGVYIMSNLLEKYNDAEISLVCYNMGEGRRKQLGVSSSKYSRGVLRDKEKLQEMNDSCKKGE